mgnify:CR=1 FL=1
MGSSFKIGSFNAIDTNDEKNPKSNNHGANDELKKKLLVFAGIILAVVIILFLVLYLFSLFTNKTYSYDEIEEVMIQAAESYFEDHSDRLPDSENQRVEIDVETLSSSEYMNPMSEYTGDALSCTGKVSVQMNGEDYLYTPQLDCGDDYVTESLKDVLIKDVVTDGYGLYQVGNSYVYRGEDVDNYLQLDQALWRIVKIMDNGQIMLILNDQASLNVPWDNRYNAEVGYNSGINTYSASRVRESLLDLYESNDEDQTILTDNDRSKLISFDVCVGKRGDLDSHLDNSSECSEVLENEKIGLLTVSDYMMASMDSNCSTTLSRSCQNYNYLVTSYEWWLATAASDSTSMAYGVETSGTVSKESTSSYRYPRAVVMLNSNALFKSGNGTFDKPYQLK